MDKQNVIYPHEDCDSTIERVKLLIQAILWIDLENTLLSK